MDPKHVHNLNLLLQAIDNNDMALLSCKDIATGQGVPVICIISGTGNGGEVAVIPVARMFVGAPLDQIKLPDDLQQVVVEHAKLKLAIAEREIAELEAELSDEAPAGGLH